MHQRRERESLEIHRRIARLMEKDCVSVIAKAKGNLLRWLKDRDDDSLSSVHREWQALLTELTQEELVALLVSEDARSTRLRQSSPFAGVLPPQEVWEIKRGGRHAAA